MTRIYHPWTKWEDFQHNFYGGVTEDWPKTATTKLYAEFLGDLDKFEAALKVVTTEWVYSCEHNLTHTGMNRVAWLGQASMALVYKVPHTVSMGGYNLLTREQQIAAAAMAQKYLDLWVEKHEASLRRAG